jgi:hypothetical protein
VAVRGGAILPPVMGWTALRHAVAAGLSLIVMATAAPVLHQHGGDAPAFYDEACPLAYLVARGSEAGLFGRVVLIQPSPTIDLLVLPASPADPTTAGCPFAPRGPPSAV